jgi:hypothetical protein
MQKWKEAIRSKEFVRSLILSLLLLFISLYINFISGNYATRSQSLPVTDVILSNTRVWDVDFFFVYGPVALYLFVVIIFLFNPKKTPFVIKSIALFTTIRAIFVSLTHLGPFPTQAITEGTNFINKFTFGGDLFFSGHTGVPFLMALIFWQNRNLRYFFLAFSVFMGVIVLLGHYHYSIDVFGAFFITYTIFHISSYLFKKDKDLFLNSQ